jgi:hypothetical protein
MQVIHIIFAGGVHFSLLDGLPKKSAIFNMGNSTQHERMSDD